MKPGKHVKVWHYDANGRKVWENAVVAEWRGEAKEKFGLADYVEIEDRYGERFVCHKKYVMNADC